MGSDSDETQEGQETQGSVESEHGAGKNNQELNDSTVDIKRFKNLQSAHTRAISELKSLREELDGLKNKLAVMNSLEERVEELNALYNEQVAKNESLLKKQKIAAESGISEIALEIPFTDEDTYKVAIEKIRNALNKQPSSSRMSHKPNHVNDNTTSDISSIRKAMREAALKGDANALAHAQEEFRKLTEK